MLVIARPIDHWQTQDGSGEIGIAHHDPFNQNLVVIVLQFMGIVRVSRRFATMGKQIFAQRANPR